MIEENGGGATGFADLMLAPELCHALSGLGYEEPTPIQRAAIPPLLDGRDLVGQAATGTGNSQETSTESGKPPGELKIPERS